MTQTSKQLSNLLAKSNYSDKTFTEEFNRIISEQTEGYSGTTKEKLESFLNDMQKGGCSSGMVGEFIYNSDCKNFYINHIDDLEEMKEDFEEQLGEPIKNLNSLPHYTFVVWLCFEEYCFDLYRTIFKS